MSAEDKTTTPEMSAEDKTTTPESTEILKAKIQKLEEQIKETDAVELFMMATMASDKMNAHDICLHAHDREGKVNPATGKWENAEIM